MRALAVIVVVFLIGCASRSDAICPDVERLERSALQETFRDANGTTLASGPHLGRDWRVADHLPAWQNVTPVGAWTYWYPNGQPRARLVYGLSCYVQCCTAGLCPHVHPYPVGSFAFWYPSGKPRARGTFVASRQHVETSCEGGDTTTKGVPSEDSEAWDETGKRIPLDVRALLEELLPFSTLGV